MISAIRSGLRGMESAAGVVNGAASDVARASIPDSAAASGPPRGDIPRAIVQMTIGHRTYDANAKVVEVAARMLDMIV